MGKSETTQLSAEQKKILAALAAMKKTGLVYSPVRCKYGVTEAGREAIS